MRSKGCTVRVERQRGKRTAFQLAVDALFFSERTVVRSGSLSIIKNCQTHFGRCGASQSCCRGRSKVARGSLGGYSPEGEGSE